MTKEGGNMVNILEKPEFKKAWSVVDEGLSIRSEADYNKAVEILNQLLDEVGDNESHPLFNFLEVLGTLIESYEEDHVKIPEVPAREVLKYLMEEHGLTQADLSDIGSQGVVSEILRGKRELNTRQIKALSKRFSVSPAVFF
jgi:HTH-type transcriptional regulator/antitoxin HigA